jgi:hypothetical protein
MFTLALVPMFGLMGLVADIGYMHFIKMSAQTAAQAAASAAIIDLKSGGSGSWCCSNTATTCPQNITTPSSSLERGCMYAQKHGFNSTNQWVTYQAGAGSTPPTATGSGTASNWVTFRVIQRVPQLFSAVTGNTSGLVAARSSASLIGASDCIFALSPTAPNAIQVSGSASLTASCGIYVNSSDSAALGSNGGGTISATEYDVVGGVETHYNLTPNPTTGVSPITDPLASLPVPASAPYTCTKTDYSPKGNVTLDPGVYCGGIQVGSNSTYTLNPGRYILVGSGLSTQSTNSNIKGDNVFIYNTFDPTSNKSSIKNYGPIDISAGSTVDLKASNTGTYAGILIFEDRNAPASSDDYGGNSDTVYQGTIYAKKAAVKMHGTSQTNSMYTIVVADTINIVGTADFKNNYSLLPTGSPVTKVAVVE